MSERFGKLASPMASGGLGGGSEEWTQVESVVPSSWVRLLEVKSQLYQAQVNHRLAHTLIYLALHGKPPPESSEDQEPLGPLPVEGLYSDDGFLESQVSSHLGTFTHLAHFSIDVKCPLTFKFKHFFVIFPVSILAGCLAATRLAS